MANQINIYDKDDKWLGRLALPLSCFAVLKKYVIEKYNPDYNEMDIENIDEQLDLVYDNCEPYEEAMMLLFINDSSDFDEFYIEHFDTAIEKYPEGVNKIPKKVLKAFRDFLEIHGQLKTSYSHSTSVVSVSHD